MIIDIKGAQNVRDLGGLIGYEGRKIKMGRIIRSSNLSLLENDGYNTLNKYGLRVVVDFRSEAEIESAPDVQMDGVKYVKCPILKNLTVGISRNGAKATIDELVIGVATELGKNAKEWLKKLYIPLVTDEFSLNGYRCFFNELIENKSGALLFHCAAGKDRVGTGAALLLLALGVCENDVISDYMLTNKSVEKSTKNAINMAKKQGIDEDIISVIPCVNGVDKSYIGQVIEIVNNCGGIEKFLNDKLGIDNKKLEILRSNYLE